MKIKISLIISVLFIAACASSGPNKKTVAVIGSLDTKLKDRIDDFFRLVPYEGGSDKSILVHANDVPTLTDAQKQGLINTYAAGLAIILFDAGKETSHAILDMIDPQQALVRSYHKSNVPRMVHVIRKTDGRHHPVAILDPVGLTNYEGALDTAVQLINEKIDQDVPKALDNSVRLQTPNSPIPPSTLVAQEDINIPQGAGGSYTSNNSVYAFHDCCGNQDIYIVESTLNTDPGSTYYSAFGSGVTKSGQYLTEVSSWQPNVVVPACGLSDSDTAGLDQLNDQFSGVLRYQSQKHSGSACKLADYPLYFYFAIDPPSSLQTSQVVSYCGSSPSAYQGSDTDYSRGWSFSIDGSLSYWGEGTSPVGIDAGATYESDTSTTIPAAAVYSGHTQSGQGQYWQFQFCSTDSTSACAATIGTQHGDPSCTNALTFPQNEQSPAGANSTSIMAFWTAGPDSRVAGGTFDISVTYAVYLANTQILDWPAVTNIEDPKCPDCTTSAGGTCCDTTFENCDCQADNSYFGASLANAANQDICQGNPPAPPQPVFNDPASLADGMNSQGQANNPAYSDLVFPIKYPAAPSDSASNPSICPAGCSASTSTCTCLCPAGTCPSIYQGCPNGNLISASGS